MSNDTLTEISDIALELQSFLGSELGASVAAEIGQDATAQVFIAGALAQVGIDNQDFDRILGHLIKTNKKQKA